MSNQIDKKIKTNLRINKIINLFKFRPLRKDILWYLLMSNIFNIM